jgi:hypothetical protein
VQGGGENRQVKEAFMTTGLVVAYANMFEVYVYNVQKMSKEGILPDYSKDYYDKIIAQKKINSKKKAEKSLS